MFTKEELEAIHWTALNVLSLALSERNDAQRHFSAYSDRPWAGVNVLAAERKVAKAQLVLDALAREGVQ